MKAAIALVAFVVSSFVRIAKVHLGWGSYWAVYLKWPWS